MQNSDKRVRNSIIGLQAHVIPTPEGTSSANNEGTNSTKTSVKVITEKNIQRLSGIDFLDEGSITTDTDESVIIILFLKIKIKKLKSD